MFLILLSLFIFVPIVEIFLFIRLGSLFGVFFTICLTIFTAVLGAFLVRTQGLFTITSIQNKLNQGSVPTTDIVSGLLLGLSGALLITPGFFTDTIGFLLLVPTIRKASANYLLNHFFNNVKAYNNTFEGEFSSYEAHENISSLDRSSDRESTIIDGEFEEKK